MVFPYLLETLTYFLEPTCFPEHGRDCILLELTLVHPSERLGMACSSTFNTAASMCRQLPWATFCRLSSALSYT